MKKEEKTFNIQEARDIIHNFLHLLNNAPDLYQELYDTVGRADRLTSDIVHDIEFNDFKQTDGYKKAIALKEARQTRRAAKETMEYVKVINEFAKNNSNLIDNLRVLQSSFDAIIDEQKRRVYTPRESAKASPEQKHFEATVDQQVKG